MDADETLTRLFRQRRYLLALAIALAVAAFFMVQHSTRPTYRADSRLVLGPELNSSQEAQTVVSRAHAIATTDSVLNTAISAAKAPRTVSTVRGEVSLTGIGDSGLARLSVTDKDPAVAAALCRAIGVATADFINTTNSQPMTATLAAIDAQLQAAVAQYQQLQSQGLGSTSVADQAQLAAINENITALSTARGQLLARQAQAVPAAVVDQPPALGTKTGSEALKVAGLCAVGALLFWLLTAAAAESLRPTLPTLRAVGRHFDAPVLGTVNASLDPDDARTAEAVDRLILSAQHLRADTLLVGGPGAGSSEFVAKLDTLLKARAGNQGASALTTIALPVGVGTRGGVAIGNALGAHADEHAELPTPRNGRVPKAAPIPRNAIPLDVAHLAPSRGTAIVVLARPGVKKAQLRAVDELVRCSYWPVVGVVQLAKANARGARGKDVPDDAAKVPA